jgi:hypothetical protein
MKIDYYIDGHKFSDYGIVVSSSKGLLAGLSPKDKIKTDWKDRHGEDVFLDNIVFQPRDIELECNLMAPDLATFMQRVSDFTKFFYTPFKKRLNVGITDNALVYDIYLNAKIDIDKKWRDGQMVGKFNLSLREPEPIKQIFKYTYGGTALNLHITTDKRLNISYGDGQFLNNVVGTNQTITHAYSQNGIYYIIVSGSMDNKVTSTNALQIWKNLL